MTSQKWTDSFRPLVSRFTVGYALAFSVLLPMQIAMLGVDNSRARADETTAAATSDDTLGAWIYREALKVFRKANVVHYEHQGGDEGIQQVSFQGDQCQANCDCSGLVSYVLKTVATKHYEAIKDFSSRTGHPLASTYARFFASLSPTESQNGWLRIMNFQDLRQGDLIAWEKAVNSDAPATATKKGNTGHVMIVEAPAGPVEKMRLKDEQIRFISIPVIDSSSVDHFPPEELPPHAHQEHRDGIGRGVVRLIVDKSGQVIGYWEGTYWGEGGKKITKPSYTESVYFARILHNIKQPAARPG